MVAEQRHRESYEEARRRFDELDADERVSFLVEATASSLAQGLEEAGRTLADGLQDIVRRARQSSQSAASSARPGPAEPETAQRQSPRGGNSSSDQ